MKRSKKFDAILQQARANQLITLIKENERAARRTLSKETLRMAMDALLQETTRPDKPGSYYPSTMESVTDDYSQSDQDLLKAAISAAALKKAGLT